MRYTRLLFLGICLIQSTCSAYASQDPADTRNIAQQNDLTAQAQLNIRKIADAQAKENAAENAKTKIAAEAKAKTQLILIESVNGVKYEGGLSEALVSNKDKGLDWFKNKAFKLDKASTISACDPGICYIFGFNGTLPLGVTQENGDFNGRQLQGQLVRVMGTDRYGTIVVSRLTEHAKTAQNRPPVKHESPVETRLATSADSSHNAQVISFDELIRARASEGWARPPSTRKGMSVVLKIDMLPDGTMSSVSVAKSSGDVPYDNSAVAAVKNVGRLSEMQTLKPNDFQRYRSFQMAFTPEDLAL